MLKKIVALLLISTTWVFADTYATLLKRYEKQIKMQEKQLGSLRQRLQEKERDVSRWKGKADTAKAAYSESSMALEATRSKMKAVHDKRVIVRTEADAAQSKTTEHVFLSRAAQRESLVLAQDLYAQELLMTSPKRITVEQQSPNYVLGRLMNLSQSAQKVAEQSQKQETALRTEEMQLQNDERARAEEADKLHDTQELHWQKWQEALRRKNALEDEISRMDQSAKALQVMVQELREHRDQARAMQTNVPRNEKALASIKGTLPWPAHGRVVQNFGRQYSDELKQLVVSNGIKINAGENHTVRSVQEGKVIYASPFRQYGQLVIVQHKNSLTSVYASLAVSNVKEGQILAALDQVGTTDAGGSFYFELRHNEQPVNPLVYLAPAASSALSSRRTFR